jgi:SAM-dependent methyltransferase
MELIGGRVERPVLGMIDSFAKRIFKGSYPSIRNALYSTTATGRARRAKDFSAAQVRETIVRLSAATTHAPPRVESAAESPSAFPPQAMTAVRISPPNERGPHHVFPTGKKAGLATEKAIDRLLAGYFPRGLYFNSSTHRRFLRDLCASIPPGSKVLDLGSGRSFRYEEFFRSFEAEWHPADLFECDDRAEYGMVADNRIPFPDSYFDVVVCMNVIEHFEDPEAMISEIARVVGRNGIVAGACAFHELEHDSYWHLSRAGLETLMRRHELFPYYMKASEYSGAILASQRHFGGGGRISRSGARATMLTVALGIANLLPFLVANLMEAMRRLSPMFDRFQDCATLFFIAEKPGQAVHAFHDDYARDTSTRDAGVVVAAV